VPEGRPATTRHTRAVRIGATAAVVAVVAAGSVVARAYAAGSPSAQWRTATATTGTVDQTLRATGSVQRANQVTALFSGSGTVATVPVTVGQRVAKGATLATLDTGSLQDAVVQARAALARAQATLESDESGTGGSGSGTGGGTDPDMPNYANAKATKAVKLKDGDWARISWPSSANADYFDGAGILIGGCRFSAVLAVKVTGRNGAVVDTSWVETEGGNPVETYETATHGAFDSATDSRNGSCQKGRRLCARVRVRGGDATLELARVTVLAWST